MADLRWHLYTPTGYRVVSSAGTVATDSCPPPELAASRVAAVLYALGGGIDYDHGLLGLLMMPLSCATQEFRLAAGRGEKYEEGGGPIEEDRALREFRADLQPMPARAPMASEAVPAAAPPPPPPTARPVEPVREEPPPTPEPVKKAPAAWALEGARSLKIALVPTGQAVTFRSLGAEPRLDISLANRRRVNALAWGLALAVLLAGVVMTRESPARKITYVVAVLLGATLLPVVPGLLGLALVLNGAFYAACLLVLYYPAAALGMRVVAKVRPRWLSPSGGAAAATALLMVLAVAVLGATQAAGGIRAANEESGAVRVPPAPVQVPADAIILPYDPKSPAGVKGADQLLIPYDRFVELWNLAYPDAALVEKRPPAPYALAGASFSGELEAPAMAGGQARAPDGQDEFLLIQGAVDLDVYTDEYAVVPLPLEGGVLARADLDGRPARLSVMTAAPPQTGSQAPGTGKVPSSEFRVPNSEFRVPSSERSFLVLYVAGKGRHRLDVAIRMKLARQGGWRRAEGRLPAAPATALALKVAQARTEVRLGAVPDRRSYETAADGQVIRTALQADGRLSVQWRPKVSEGEVDLALTADSTARLDVQEDLLRLTWHARLSFRRGEREFFTIGLPAGYLVEKVEGTNVRGWEVRAADGGQRLEVGLLRPAKESEEFTVQLWRPGPIPAGEVEMIGVPVVNVTGAVRHTGRLLLARSPLLDVRTVEASGATRVDLPAAAPPHPPAPLPQGERGEAPSAAGDESPLGIRPYQAYEFVAVPFTVRLEVRSVAARVTATVQTILRIAEREHGLEGRILLDVEDRPIHSLSVVLPADLEVDDVTAPGSFEWGLSDHPRGRLLTVYLASGLQGRVALLVRGRIPAGSSSGGRKDAVAEGRAGSPAPPGRSPAAEAAVPRLEVLNVRRQAGDIVVQVDPSYDVHAADLKHLDRALLDTVASWLASGQRRLARLVLHYTDPDYAGRLVLSRRRERVSGYTVTNVRVTDRAIEETVLVDLKVRDAGIREVRFRLPEHLAQARVTVPLLRQKTVEAVPGAGEVRFILELQDEVMNELRVVVDGDRLLVPGEHEAPVPVLETGETERRYVALESSGRDEVVIAAHEGLDPLSRQSKEWRTVAGLLRGGTTQAFLVSPTAQRPRLAYRTVSREVVETAAARIGLGRTVLLFDPSGAYRAEVRYSVSNSTEQFLAIELPEGAALWTVQVAGEVVKPAAPDPQKDPRLVWVPLTKSVAGDLDYAVVIRYGGKLAPPGHFGRVRFPLIRTRNINVELSQLELYLPRTDEWFWFGDRMRPVAEAGDYEQVTVSYWNDVLSRQAEALQDTNYFARVRAVGNTAVLQQMVDALQNTYGELTANPKLAQELSKAKANLRIFNQEAGQADLPAQAGATVTVTGYGDNRGTLFDFSRGQHNIVAGNATLDAGPNWDAGTVNVGGGTVTTFNDAWLAKNKLETSLEEARKEVAEAHDQTAEQVKVTESRAKQFADYKEQVQAGQAGQAGGQVAAQADRWQDQQQPAAPQIVLKGDLDEVLTGKKSKDVAARRRDQREVVQRYQEKLQKQVEEQQRVLPQPRSADRHEWGRAAGPPVLGRVPILGGAFQTARDASVRAADESGAAAYVPLVSLAVDLPQLEDPEDLARRWTRYQFTTPRGEVEMTAWTASGPMIAGLKRLVVVVLAVAAVLGLREVLRRRGLPAGVQEALAIGLIVVGGAGLFFGVFPIAGLVAVGAGIVWRVWQRAVGRRQAARAAA